MLFWRAKYPISAQLGPGQARDKFKTYKNSDGFNTYIFFDFISEILCLSLRGANGTIYILDAQSRKQRDLVDKIDTIPLG